MTKEHLKGVEISAIEIDALPEVQASWTVGQNGVTRIEAFTKSGMYADIPYVRVWKGDSPAAEYCQHNIVGVYFKQPDSKPASPI
jgi:hypothetical protein